MKFISELVNVTYRFAASSSKKREKIKSLINVYICTKNLFQIK